MRQIPQQLTVVVEHLLEVRNHPELIDGVARKPAAELIVNAAFAHSGERQSRHVERMKIRLFLSGARTPGSQQEFDRRWMRKLGCTAETAETRVEFARQHLASHRDRFIGEGHAGLGRRRRNLLERLLQCMALLRDVLRARRVKFGNARKQIGECGQPMARVLGEISTPEEGTMIDRREKHRQGPAAAALDQHLMCELIDPVQIGPFLAIHFDVHEQLVHDRGRGGIFERFVRHDMAPVTRGIADRQQDRFVLRARLLQCFGAPRIPIDGIIRMLEQVRTGLLGKAIEMPSLSGGMGLSRSVRRMHVGHVGKLEFRDYNDEHTPRHIRSRSVGSSRVAVEARRRSPAVRRTPMGLFQ